MIFNILCYLIDNLSLLRINNPSSLQEQLTKTYTYQDYLMVREIGFEPITYGTPCKVDVAV